MKISRTRKKESLNATYAVINTAELLEIILDQLPFLDLVIAATVNYRFRDCINGSKKLKRKLFIHHVASTKHKLNKHGVIGSLITQADLWDSPIQEPVNLLPSLLENSTIPQTAHLSERAVKVAGLPYDKYLTNPPCAHLTVHFTYVCVAPDDTHIQLEAIRSSYRAKGATLLSVQKMLFQCGTVKVWCGERKGFQKHACIFERQTTMRDQIEHYEQLYDCKMRISLPQTTLYLYADILP
jgi:hypothetical protein